MRVAICLSGLIRSKNSWVNTIEKIKKTSTEICVFVHSQYLTKPCSSSVFIDSSTDNNVILKYMEPQCILDILQPNSYLFDHYEIDVLPLCRDLTDIMHCAQYGKENSCKTYSMYYSIYKANELKKDWENKNNIKFDVVYRIRSDIELLNEHDLPRKTIQPNTLYVPANDHHGGLNDQFAFGDSPSMDLYSSCFLNIKNIKDEFGSANPHNSESLLIKYITTCCKLDIHYTNVETTIIK